jgi:surfactin synthase thioesterase subunit
MNRSLDDEPITLFCFPHAGGGGAVYRGWAARLPARIQVIPVTLPGREARIREPLLRSLPVLIERLVEETRARRGGRFAFFGHSLGALIAFQLTRALRRAGEPLPLALCVSACRAPHLIAGGAALSRLDDSALLGVVSELAGTPDVVLRDPELRALTLATMRADFSLRESYLHDEEPALSTPITVFGGQEDRHVPRASLTAWLRYTCRAFTLATFAGGHFYYREQPRFYAGLAAAVQGSSASTAP